MNVRPKVIALLSPLLAASLGCDSESAKSVATDTGSEAANGSSAVANGSVGGSVDDGHGGFRPRRPSQRFALLRNESRCAVFMEEGTQRTKVLTAQCPRDLLAGEVIRLTGHTCIRDGGTDAGRHVPVRCPGELLAAERAARHDAGR